jgi:hypothetical protein
MAKKIIIGLLLVIVGVIFAAALQPDEFALSRSTDIAASPADIFPRLNDFHRWEDWSPWAKLDPNMQVSYEGPSVGEGSVYKWSGASEVGEGKMTLLKSQPLELVRIQLDFLKPMEASNITEFSLAPVGQGTRVTWTMTGKNDFIGKVFCLFMSMEKMVGPDFEKGLAQLKTTVEGGKAPL